MQGVKFCFLLLSAIIISLQYVAAIGYLTITIKPVVYFSFNPSDSEQIL
jgi:hypothetical protein